MRKAEDVAAPNYADNARHHLPLPWECPEHGEAILHGSREEGLYCGICREIAALIERERAAWQPIETAPKDGTRILAYRGPNKRSPAGIWAVWWNKYYHEWHVMDDSFVRGFTRWMPLPKPPEGA